MKRAAALAGYVAATFFAFPHPLGEGVLDLGLVCAPLAPALLALAVRGASPARGARWGFLGGWLAHAAVLHWIYVVTVRYGHAPAIVGVLAPLGIGAYFGLFGAAFGASAAALARRGWASPFALAALWTALEWSRSWLFTGFPWATLGYAWHGDAPIVGIAQSTGVYGLSFAAALLGFGLLAGRASPRAAGAAVAGVAALHALGWLGRPDWDRASETPSARVAVLQGNVDQAAKWSPESFERTLRDYEALARRARERGAELIVFPETAIPAPLAIPELRSRMQALARETGATLVVGAVGTDFDPSGRVSAFYDSAFVIAPDGALVDRYDKTHLVPFGEYLPLRPLLGRFVRAIATGAVAGDVSAGARPRAVPGAPRLGIPICYELIFPDLVRRIAGDGAQLLLGITNDAWYGRTGAPYQFLAMTALRSAETGSWTARAANTGVSALIDARGRVTQATGLFAQDLLVGAVPLRPASLPPTFYVRHGDWFAHACAVATVLALALAPWVGRKREQT